MPVLAKRKKRIAQWVSECFQLVDGASTAEQKIIAIIEDFSDSEKEIALDALQRAKARNCCEGDVAQFALGHAASPETHVVDGRDIICAWENFLQFGTWSTPDPATQFGLEFKQQDERQFISLIPKFPQYVNALASVLSPFIVNFLDHERRELRTTSNSHSDNGDRSGSIISFKCRWNEFVLSELFLLNIWTPFVNLYDPRPDADEFEVQESQVNDFLENFNCSMYNLVPTSYVQDNIVMDMSPSKMSNARFLTAARRFCNIYLETFIAKQNDDMMEPVYAEPVRTHISLNTAHEVLSVSLAGWIVFKLSDASELSSTCRTHLTRVFGWQWQAEGPESWHTDEEIAELLTQRTEEETLRKGLTLLRWKNHGGLFRPTYKMYLFFMELEHQVQIEIKRHNASPSPDSLTERVKRIKDCDHLKHKYHDAIQLHMKSSCFIDSELDEGQLQSYHECGFHFFVWKWIKMRLYYVGKHDQP